MAAPAEDTVVDEETKKLIAEQAAQAKLMNEILSKYLNSFSEQQIDPEEPSEQVVTAAINSVDTVG